MIAQRFLPIGVLCMLVSIAVHAQDRDVRTQRLVLDDNSNNTIIISTPAGPITGGTLTIPDPAGAGQFLISTPSGGTQSVSGHLLPGGDNLYDLGSGTFRWRDFFLSGNLQLGTGLRLTEPGGTDYSEFIAQAQGNNITYTLPATNGAAGQVLRIASSPAPTSSAATLEWAAAAGSGWGLTGNAGTTTGTNFVGTTDDEPFEIHVDETGTATEGRRRVMRFEPNGTSANIIGGFSGNSVTSGAVGAVISGGGENTNTNIITDDYGVVGGGRNNRAGDNAGATNDAITATVGGGIGNTASGGGATIAGGGNNVASGVYATVGGGTINAASSTAATVAGGFQNTASGAHSTIAGGNTNTISGDYSAIPGGRGLTFSAAAARSFGFHANNSGGTRSMTIAAPDVAVFGNADLWLANNDNAPSELRFFEGYNSAGTFPNGANYTAFKAAQTQNDNITYTLPAVNGTAGQVLAVAASPAPTATDATLEWATASGSGWSLTGNASTTPGTNFVGTTDNQAFEIHVDEAGTATQGRRRVMRFEPNGTSANIIGGFNGNSITGSTGSVIGGGGSNGATTINSIATSNYGAIAGGTGNIVVGSTNVMIGAGLNDTISTSNYSFIGGGNANSIVGASASVIPGGNYLKIGSNSFGFNGLTTAAQTDISLTGANFSSVAYFGNADLLIGNVDGVSRALRFYEPNSSFSYSGAQYSAFKAQPQNDNITYTLPAANGTDGQVLRLATGATATAGTLEWATDAGLVLPFSNTTSSASTLFDITNSGSGQAGNFNITGAKTATTTTMVVDNDATNTTTDAINKTVLSVASSGTFTGSGGGSTTATGVDINMTGTGGDVNKGMTIAVAGTNAIGLQISSGRLVYSVASVTHPSAAFTAPNNAAIIKVTDNGANSGNANLTLSTTGVVEGQVVWVYNGDPNDNIEVQSTPNRTLNSGATNRDLWQFIYIDGAWRPLR